MLPLDPRLLERQVSSELWFQRETQEGVTDRPIPRVHFSEFEKDPGLFEREFRSKNKPAIIVGLDPSHTSQCGLPVMSVLQSRLQSAGSDWNLHSVLESQDGRFLFWDEHSEQRKKQSEVLKRQMSLDEFAKAMRNQDDRRYLYCYAESLSDSLMSALHFNPAIPGCLVSDAQEPSVLFWANKNGSVSPLHFDFCEGLLCQISGLKRVLLCDHSHSASLVPYPVESPHRRQSQIRDLSQMPRSVDSWQGCIAKSEALFIPFSMWHRIESLPLSIAGEMSVSLSYRWNPYIQAARQSFRIYRGLSTVPSLAQSAFEASLDGLPPFVERVMSVWRRCFEARLDSLQNSQQKGDDNGHSNHSDDLSDGSSLSDIQETTIDVD